MDLLEATPPPPLLWVSSKPHHWHPSDASAYAKMLTTIWRAQRITGFTSLDMMHLHWIPLQKFQSKIKWILDSLWPDNIIQMNIIYKKAIERMERVLLRKIPEKLKDRVWTSTDEFLHEFHQHVHKVQEWTKGAHAMIFCAILKCMYIEWHMYINDTVIKNLDSDMEALVSYLQDTVWIIFDNDASELDGGFSAFRMSIIWDKAMLRWKIEYRPKQEDSIWLKQIAQRKYDELDKFKDLYAIRIELDKTDWEDSYIALILQIARKLFIPWRTVTMEMQWDILSDGGIRVLRSAWIIVDVKKKKEGSSEGYWVIKFIDTPAWIWESEKKPEIQFVLPDNKNNVGLAHHDIYHIRRVLLANIRLFWILTEWNLKDIIIKYEEQTNAYIRAVSKEELIRALIFWDWNEQPLLKIYSLETSEAENWWLYWKRKWQKHKRFYFGSESIESEWERSLWVIYPNHPMNWNWWVWKKPNTISTQEKWEIVRRLLSGR